jgi:hypothetical protein
MYPDTHSALTFRYADFKMPKHLLDIGLKQVISVEPLQDGISFREKLLATNYRLSLKVLGHLHSD